MVVKILEDTKYRLTFSFIKFCFIISQMFPNDNTKQKHPKII